ncbi:putative lipid II flippase FtsW [Candidatus Woesebacteria bacterium]|nr:putative lipid II flippase FtsW [Candidatus Woesebacteria bacterium]|tara:strand:+ start:1504 stop:2613 length:1110 start_codon:yes stop_codon:yes gene_type:complete
MRKFRSPVLRSQTRRIDKHLLFVVLALSLFGVMMVFNASGVDATRNFGDQFFFAKRQLIWAAFGALGLLFFSRIPYQLLQRFALPIFGISLLLLGLVLLPNFGISSLGASRWLEIGPIVFQPAEFAKLALVIYLAAILAKNRSLVLFLITVGLTTGLVLVEPDLGTAAVIAAIGLVIYFVSGAPLWYFFAILPAALISGLILTLTSAYRKERLMTFLNPEIDPLGTSYHIRQILIALGSGGLFGMGLGQSRQKYLFLPEPTTDSIFAIIGEELGFIGSAAVVLAFIYIIWKGFTIASRVSDPFGKLLAVGVTSWIGIQAVVNLSSMVAFIPLTGVPLPLLSYGGSSLITMLAAVGILLNVSKFQTAKAK